MRKERIFFRKNLVFLLIIFVLVVFVVAQQQISISNPGHDAVNVLVAVPKQNLVVNENLQTAINQRLVSKDSYVFASMTPTPATLVSLTIPGISNFDGVLIETVCDVVSTINPPQNYVKVMSGKQSSTLTVNNHYVTRISSTEKEIYFKQDSTGIEKLTIKSNNPSFPDSIGIKVYRNPSTAFSSDEIWTCYFNLLELGQPQSLLQSNSGVSQPNPGHNANEISVSADGGEMTLREAVSQRKVNKDTWYYQMNLPIGQVYTVPQNPPNIATWDGVVAEVLCDDDSSQYPVSQPHIQTTSAISGNTRSNEHHYLILLNTLPGQYVYYEKQVESSSEFQRVAVRVSDSNNLIGAGKLEFVRNANAGGPFASNNNFGCYVRTLNVPASSVSSSQPVTSFVRHSSDKVRVTVAGNQKTLQQAIDDKSLSVNEWFFMANLANLGNWGTLSTLSNTGISDWNNVFVRTTCDAGNSVAPGVNYYITANAGLREGDELVHNNYYLKLSSTDGQTIFRKQNTTGNLDSEELKIRVNPSNSQELQVKAFVSGAIYSDSDWRCYVKVI